MEGIGTSLLLGPKLCFLGEEKRGDVGNKNGVQLVIIIHVKKALSKRKESFSGFPNGGQILNLPNLLWKIVLCLDPLNVRCPLSSSLMFYGEPCDL